MSTAARFRHAIILLSLVAPLPLRAAQAEVIPVIAPTTVPPKVFGAAPARSALAPELPSLPAPERWPDYPVTSSRTERFSAPGAVTALDVSTLRGAVRIVPGKVFSATVELIGRGVDKASADQALAETKVVFTFESGNVKLETGFDHHDHERGGFRGPRPAEARYDIVVPAVTSMRVHTIDAHVTVQGLGASTRIESVNGPIVASGSAHEARLRTVNGSIQAHLDTLGTGASLHADTVNGPITLWMPAATGVKLAARTLNGNVVSTLPFPPHVESFRHGPFNRSYEGSTGSGDVDVRLSSVNGRLALCANGTTLEQAKPLVTRSENEGPAPGRGGRIAFFNVRDADGGDLKQDKIDGDLVIDRSTANISVKKVSGRVKVSVRSGDVDIGAAGGPVDVDTHGGNIRLQSAGGDVRARSGAGDIRVDSSSGNAHLETRGGDIRLDAAAGDISAHSRGGDISIRRARGGVKAETDGGDITVELTAPEAKSGVELATKGGDVTLTLPANIRADVDIEIRGASDDGRRVVSDFPQLQTRRDHNTQIATGKLGGGGPPITVRARSGTVTVKKGPGT